MLFTESFIIRNAGNDSYYVHNEVFRLILD